MEIRKSRYIKSNWTHYYTSKFNMALNLCRALGVTFYFSGDFLEVIAVEVVAF